MNLVDRTAPSPACHPVLSPFCHPERSEGSAVGETLATCHPERSTSPAKRAMRAVEGSLRFARALWERVNGVRKLSATVLREIFDESAYERFLARRQLAPSPGAYAAFCRDHEQTKARRPRCC